MAQMLAPRTADELAAVITEAAEPLEILGSGSKRGLGRPTPGLAALSMAAFSGVSLYDPAELLIEAGAATPLADIEELLAARNQQFAFDPPAGGTIGGAVACNLSGPRRIKAGALRDHILRVEGVTGRGEIFKAGARVVKNVTGYDLPKLLAGSYGTLAALTSVTLKVLPKPETEETLIVPDRDPAAAVRTMSDALQSPLEISGAAFVPGKGTLLRIEGIEASVGFRMARLKAMFPGAQQAAASPWQAVRARDRHDHPVLWRVSMPPMAAAGYLASLGKAFTFDYILDWGGGLIWLSCDAAHADVVRGALQGGHATLVRAPDDTRLAIPVFQPQAAALFDITRKVKAAYDPKGLLNPGRMYEGV